jgi:hypothetical protein
MLMRSVMDDLLTRKESPLVERATIIRDGLLMPGFSYLSDYLNNSK